VRAAGLLLALAAACGGDAPPSAPPAYPPGTVLAVGGAPIAAAEVEEARERVRLVYPERSASFHATQALQSLVLPRAALRLAYAGPRAAARAECDAALARIRAGEDPPGEEREGGWGRLSLHVWDAARRLDPGQWSEPLEDLGAFYLVRLVRRGGFERHPAEEVLTVRVLEFGYLPATFQPPDLDAALAAARLEVVDPAYEELVPETLRYKMKGTAAGRSSP
jgi:hypothetical protein